LQGVALKEKRSRQRSALTSLPLSPGDFFTLPTFYRPCWVEIDRAAVRNNLKSLLSLLRGPTRLLAVVKANAYGHGLLPVSWLALEAGAAFLGVSSLEEGVALREAGFTAPVLILGSLYPFDSFPLLFEHSLTPTVASTQAADALNALARKRRTTLGVHLKIDSGFGRIGVSAAHARSFIEHVSACAGLRIEGLYTHFASSDRDPAYTQKQARAFQSVVRAAARQGVRPRWIHMANSSALLRYPQLHGTLVRPGLAIYGVSPYPGAEKRISLQPALAWKTHVVFVKTVPAGASISYARTWTARRPTQVATLAVGYADGYPRLLSNRGYVLLRGKRVAVLGRVTMDMIMVNASQIPLCRVGDEAVLIGSQGDERIAVEELAEWAQTNSYEILCRIASRVPRVYR
jgi:alanine racemase